MQTQLTEEMRQNARALEADSILRACVHCGFCTATCPTYQLLGAIPLAIFLLFAPNWSGTGRPGY